MRSPTDPDDTPTADPLAAAARLEGVPQAVSSARAAIDAVLADAPARGPGGVDTADALLRAAWASARLEGSAVDFDDLRAERTSDPVATGAVRVSVDLMALVPVFRVAPLQALARLHTLAAVGMVDQRLLGRPRGAGEHALPDDPLQIGPPVAPEEARDRLQLLGRTVLTTQAPPLVVAAVVHGELLSLRPFTVANGLVARAAARIVLVGLGTDPLGVLVPEMVHHRQIDAYVAAIRGYTAASPGGVGAWIEHCAQAVTSAAEVVAGRAAEVRPHE